MMHRSAKYRWMSWLLIAAGAFLLFLGVRELVESHTGQITAEKEFEQRAAQPAPEPGPGAQPEFRAYNPGETVAKLLVPRLDEQLYVVEGTDKSDLRLGPGHMTGTVLPGMKGNCVIAGHRDTHFRFLKDIHKGDDIILETEDGQFLYRVTNTEVVTPTNTSSLQPTDGAELNLITCYPFYYLGSAPKRFIVHAQLAGAVEASTPHKLSPRDANSGG
jgi:sortase A